MPRLVQNCVPRLNVLDADEVGPRPVVASGLQIPTDYRLEVSGLEYVGASSLAPFSTAAAILSRPPRWRAKWPEPRRSLIAISCQLERCWRGFLGCVF
jgi:hypothetical protein